MKAIVTRYKGPTDHRGSRILVTAEGVRARHYSYQDCENASRVSGRDPHQEAAERFARDLGWLVDGKLNGTADGWRLVGGGLPDGRGQAFVFVFDALFSVMQGVKP